MKRLLIKINIVVRDHFRFQSCCENQIKIISIEEHCQKFEAKVLKEQEKKGKNSKTKDHFEETVKRLKMLEIVCEQRNLSDFNLRGDLFF